MIQPFPGPLRRRSLPGRPLQAPQPVWLAPDPPAALDLVVDPADLSGGPIVRGRGPAHRILNGRRVSDPAAMRAGLPVADDPSSGHLARFRRDRPDRHALAVAGCGNLGMNPGVLGLRSEDEHLIGAPGPVGTFLEVDAEGRARALGREGPEAAPRGGFALSGPRLVCAGRAVEPEPSTWADPRHLLSFPFLTLGGHAIDFGHDRLLADPDLLAAAVSGEVVSLALREALPVGDRAAARLAETSVPRPALQRALDVKGYREVATPRTRGDYRIDADGLHLVFHEGLYPHHVLAVTGTGRAGALLVAGASNREGITARGLAHDLAEAGVRDAIVLDNGGDVGLYSVDRDRHLLRSAEADRSARWALTAALVWHVPREA